MNFVGVRGFGLIIILNRGGTDVGRQMSEVKGRILGKGLYKKVDVFKITIYFSPQGTAQFVFPVRQQPC